MTSARRLAKLIEDAKAEIADARKANDTEMLRQAEQRLADLLAERRQ